MDPTAILALATEILKAYNTGVAQNPPIVGKAWGLVSWNTFRTFILPFMPPDQRAVLLDMEKHMLDAYGQAAVASPEPPK